MNTPNLNEIELKGGSHSNREEGMCAMEAVAWLAGEPHSDAPQCACPVIAKYVIGLNDRLNPDERQLLKPYLSRIIGTRDGNAQKRAEILAMGAVTKVTPHAIEFVGLKDHADKMRQATNLTDARAAAIAASNAAAYAAAAAADAADDDAAESAADAACAAAYAAAYAAAAAADAADDDAADAAAYAAAAAADAAIRQTIVNEAMALLDEVINVRGGES